MARISLFTALLLAAVLAIAGCSGLSSASGSGQPPPPTAQADHVFLVVLENHSFGQVVGNPVMPFLNSLATQHSMAANYFADAHPSIPNYFMMSTGDLQTFDDNFSGTISADNLVRSLTGAKKTWKVYAEGLPSVGYTGPSVGTYLRRHNPFSFLSDVTGDRAQAANMVPFSQFSSDLNAGTLANFVYLLPDRQQDAHDCPNGAPTCPDNDKLAAADNWLQANIGPLLSSPNFGNSVLIITFDESISTDLTNGGGQVLTVLAGPHVKTGFSSTTLFQHQSVLRLILQLLSATDMPGASANANAMGEFFQ
ncbi:MAG TPA: alkaline phosphatase family protein [Candidatus Angelobacter sp.]|nr:alkaline phosphatase family protein [Candidatus Angelobacter sp.]